MRAGYLIPIGLMVLGLVGLRVLTGGWRRYETHVPHDEFVKRWQKLPKVEGGIKERFR